jgi:Fis family transcriptional regulator, factor for inversion stimulation protein
LKRELDGLVMQMHSSGIPYSDAVRQFKKRYILEVLAHHKGNQCKAADELGMHRNTLSRTLSELDLDTTQIRSQLREQIRNGLRRPPTSERPIQNLQNAAITNVQNRVQGIAQGTTQRIARTR